MTNHKLPVPEGTVLQDKYLVGRLLGRGGMGVVMAARHLLLDTDVALKFLFTAQPDVVERFSREARAAARIQSEHVARVLDVGALADGAPFIVMEYLAGEDLSQVLTRGPIAVVDAVDYILQACEAIAEAHALGIVHRDLKPANLFLARRALGRSMVKVLDFGISRGGARGMPTLTGTALLGSPQYMSPEQWTEARAVDARSDLWSLGVVLYEMLAGRRPFEGESLPTIFTAIANATPAPLPATVPPALEAAVLKCLEKDAGSRFPDVASLAAAIGGFGSTASRPLLDRIAHIGGLGQESLADTGRREAPTAEARADAAVAAMDVPVGGTVMLPTGAGGGRPRAGTAVLVETSDGQGAHEAPAAPATRPPTVSPKTVRPVATARGAATARVPGRAPAAAPALPAKLASIALGAVGAIAVVVVVIVRVTGGHGSRPPSVAETRPAATAPAPAPSPAPPTAAPVAPAAAPAPTTGVIKEPAPRAAEPAAAPSAPSPAVPSAADEDTPPRPLPPHGGIHKTPPHPTTPAAEGNATARPTRERPKASARASEAGPAKAGAHWSAACSRLLERQSLGETLNRDDLALYMRECRR